MQFARKPVTICLLSFHWSLSSWCSLVSYSGLVIPLAVVENHLTLMCSNWMMMSCDLFLDDCSSIKRSFLEFILYLDWMPLNRLLLVYVQVL